MALSMDVDVANPAASDKDSSLLWLRAKAIWDTGAQLCMISRALCRKLKFEPRIKVKFSGVGGEFDGVHDVVYLSLSCDNVTFLIALAGVTESIPGGYDMLIGMDVITQGDFNVSTTNGTITFTFAPYPGKLKRRT